MKEPLTIHGSGKSKRDFTYVEDLARALDLIIHASSSKVESQVFNMGSGKSYSIKEIADLVIKIMKYTNRKKRIKFTSYALNIGDRPGQVFRHTADASKIAKTLGWKPKTDFKTGLRKTIN